MFNNYLGLYYIKIYKNNSQGDYSVGCVLPRCMDVCHSPGPLTSQVLQFDICLDPRTVDPAKFGKPRGVMGNSAGLNRPQNPTKN